MSVQNDLLIKFSHTVYVTHVMFIIMYEFGNN